MGSDSGSDSSKDDKNVVDPNNPKSGQYDPNRERTLGYNDFIGDGMYGPDNAKGEEKDKPNFAERRANWNDKALKDAKGLSDTSEVSDAAVTAARQARSSRSQKGGKETLGGSVGPHGLNQADDVARVQTALVEEEQLDEVTGYPGTKMVDATKKHQAQKGLKVDGIINPGGPTEASLFGEKTKTSKPQTEAQRVDAHYDKQMANIAAHEKEKAKAQKAYEKQQQKDEALREARREFRDIDAGVMKTAKAQGFDWSGKNSSTRAAPEADNPPGYDPDETIADVESQAREIMAASERAVAAERKQQADENAARQRREWQKAEEEGMAKLRAAVDPSQQNSLEDDGIDWGLAWDALSQDVTNTALKGAAGITATMGAPFGYGVDWDKYNRLSAYVDRLVSAEDAQKTEAKIGSGIGSTISTVAELGLLGGASTSAGEKAAESARQGKSAAAQARAGLGQYALGATVDRLAKIGTAATRMGKGLAQSTTRLDNFFGAVEEGIDSGIGYGLDLLADKKDKGEKKNR